MLPPFRETFFFFLIHIRRKHYFNTFFFFLIIYTQYSWWSLLFSNNDTSYFDIPVVFDRYDYVTHAGGTNLTKYLIYKRLINIKPFYSINKDKYIHLYLLNTNRLVVWLVQHHDTVFKPSSLPIINSKYN